MLQQFAQSRQETLATLRSIDFDRWLRTGWHTGFCQVSLLQQASYFAGHERYHLPQITQVKAAVLRQ